ncbi:hypothetical protein AURDEDRAFT_121826 [Auricularia subglabra TFB-10046 SS5]|nr:hypothetical protein AURDEDRAFT_121826 [Auricularia subglabra TFB-10046 SS5]
MSDITSTSDPSDSSTVQKLLDPVFQTLPWQWDHIPPPQATPTPALPTSDIWTPHLSANDAALFPMHELFDARPSYDAAQGFGGPLPVHSFPEMSAPSSRPTAEEIENTFGDASGTGVEVWVYNLGTVRGKVVQGASRKFTSTALAKDIAAKAAEEIKKDGWFFEKLKGGRRSISTNQ